MKHHPILDRAQSRGINLGLQQFRNYVEYALQSTLAIPTVQVAGTNGKGSVSHGICSVYHLGGYKCGLYTSPHLEHINERIRINDQEISDEDLDRLLYRVEKTAIVWAQSQEITDLEEHPFSYFEMLTAVALFYFEENHVDIAVYEVGLGGRLDATSIIHPIASVITSISMDHMDYLGDDIQSIAYEKGSILRHKIPVVIGNIPDEAFTVIRLIAEERNTPIYRYDYEYILHAGEETHLKFQDQKLLIQPRMLGEHQKHNMSIVAMVCLLLQAAFPISIANIQQGIIHSENKGRLEQIHPQILLDCAHNEGGAQALRMFLEQKYKNAEQCQKPILVFGASSDKDIRRIIIEISQVTSDVLVVQSNHPRAIPCQTLAQEISFVENNIIVVPDLEILQTYLKTYIEEQRDIVCCGSIYLVGYLRPILHEMFVEHA